MNYTNWSPGEPSGGSDENCLVIWSEGQSEQTYMTWNDANCESSISLFICEKPQQKGSPEKLWIGLNDLVTDSETRYLTTSQNTYLP